MLVFKSALVWCVNVVTDDAMSREAGVKTLDSGQTDDGESSISCETA